MVAATSTSFEQSAGPHPIRSAMKRMRASMGDLTRNPS
jgi:hypothetical protein